jgi:hypothetical protein
MGKRGRTVPPQRGELWRATSRRQGRRFPWPVHIRLQRRSTRVRAAQASILKGVRPRQRPFVQVKSAATVQWRNIFS